MSTALIIILLAIGYIVFTIDKKQENFPVPVVLLLIGIALSFIPYFSDVQVTGDIIYNVFLPGLLFTSAYRFSTTALRKNAGIIAMLSTFGIILTAGLMGVVVYYLGGLVFSITFLGALLVASILTPTDPVSVVAILKKASPNKSIADIVDGESLINDGTSIVLFSVISGMYINHKAFNVWSILGEFSYVSIGGIGLGIVVGWLLSKAVHYTHHRDYQVMLSIIIAYGVFQLAESFGFSGVLATVAAGIMLSWEFTHINKEDHYSEALSGFWDVVEPTLLSLLFLLIGIVATDYLTFTHWGLAIGVFIATILIRFLVVSSTMQLFSGLRKMVDWKKAFLISWSGIRGSMSVFLLLSLSTINDVHTNNLISLAFPVVIISLVVQSLGIYPLSKWMGGK
ncbi:sodium:proton antiporter [Paenisporosarcina sp. TG20]|uniref:cation:proton antiporter n=1 Tax=Paenisporosarcina sp. TG20 TaxID=1211706 RepID=UPI0002F5F61D|nr:sodium:proton antiporter [Paenisporosarcina sp. TG20]